MGVKFSEGGSFSPEGLALVLLVLYALVGRIAKYYTNDIKLNSYLIRPNIQVVVLGDIGLSPRMQYHAVSLSNAGCSVDLIGYRGTKPSNLVTTNRYINLRYITPAWSVPAGFPKIIYVLWAPFKAAFVSFQLLWLMGLKTLSPNCIIIQNPPSIPTLAIARFVSWFRHAWLIIDWHNFGHSILALRLGRDHPIVKLAQKYEYMFGNKAYAHLTVTERMRKELETGAGWRDERDGVGVRGKVITFYDRPPSHFERLDLAKAHEFLRRVQLHKLVESQSLNAKEFLGSFDPADENTTLLTQRDPKTNEISYRSNRPQLIVSSTSWTEDEDFSILLSAIEKYEQNAPVTAPNLLFVITGKGPLKLHYEQLISKMQLSRTRIVTAWLEASDYPRLLGSADLGVSLHYSTSGMDLPMKVVDMFGCGLPVLARNFEALPELVHNGENGVIFNNAEELSQQLLNCFGPDSRLEQLRENVIFEYQDQSWERNWKELLPSLFIDDVLLAQNRASSAPNTRDGRPDPLLEMYGESSTGGVSGSFAREGEILVSNAPKRTN